jgi:SIR2-like domain
VISHEKLVSGHGFSFTDQPDLRALFRDVQDLGTPLTIVVGAGVSMNAGLLSWRELIEKMVEQIKDEHLREMALRDTSDPMRKAEIILQLIKKDVPETDDSGRLDARIISTALYPANSSGSPGLLAQSIARLVVARKRNVRLITTNFDTVLETALEAYFDETQVRAFSLDGYEEWQSWGAAGKIGVLHVHGVIRPRLSRARFAGPIVLTESQFFKRGAHVREIIARNLADANAIFVGLSMTDPNLIGPMYETRNRQETVLPRYALAVPDHNAGADNSAESMRYSIEAAEFMARELGLSTIFLKSYSQLNQVLADLSLAIEEAQRYQPDGELVYENRLKRTLDLCYARIGCPDEEQFPRGAAAETLHNKLYAALRAPDGPVAVLRRLAAPYGGHRIGEPDGENFALFLWLASRPGPNKNYALNLVASSAYIHREMWSIRWWDQPIVRESTIVAVNAIYMGTNIATNLGRGTRIWRGIMACPIVMSSMASNKRINGVPLDTVTIGAITLNSTHYVDKHDPNLPPDEDHSAVVALDAQETEQVFTSIAQAAKSILSES